LTQRQQLNIKIMKLELTVIDQNGTTIYTGSSLEKAILIRDFCNEDVSWCDNGAYIVIN
jgi:hypothetical protein